nr:splicing factor [Tanacetum cinerariifolium]
MKNDIREKYLINVSIGQCKRAKQRALFYYERGLREHYGRLWEYRHAILNSNPWSTCRLNNEEIECGNYYFRRIYVCFKGVNEGWLAGRRKVIGLDGCFLKHTCRGELLVAIGRDPIKGVDHCYSQEKWFQAYQFNIKPVFGRSRKNRIKAQSENNSQVSRVGGKMTCTNCQETGHNKSSCKQEPVPKPPKVNRPPVLKPPGYGTYGSARGRGRGSMGGRDGFGGRGERTVTMGNSSANIGATRRSQIGRERGQRGRGRGQREKGRGQMLRDETQESVAANISDMGEIGFKLGDFEAEDNYKSNADLEIPTEDPIAAVTPNADKGKQLAEPSEQPELQPQAIKRG